MRHYRGWYRVLGSVAVAMTCIGCQDEESVAREHAAGDYEVVPRDRSFYTRQVLTLRPDGTWLRRRMNVPIEPQHMGPDSGTYRIVGVTLNLRSIVFGGLPTRYTMLGDTLFGANAAEMQRVTGDDIGEERLIRQR